MPTPTLAEYCRAQLPPTLDFLRRMVAINSFTRNARGVNDLARLIATEFAPLGFTAEFVKSANPEYGHHLILARRANPAAPTIALISHLDTVFTAEEEAQNQFAWREEGRKIYGPGTNDIKGGTAMIHLVLQALQHSAPQLFAETNWFVLHNASEETISAEFGRVCRAHLPADTLACLLFEADGGEQDDFKLVTARKGRATFTVRVDGVAAHAGGDHARGANAIVELARVIERLAALTNYEAGITVNVGTVGGGTVINRVPHAAQADLEMRSFSVEAYSRAKEAILGMAGEGSVRTRDGHACQISVALNDESHPWPSNARSDALFACWKTAGDRLGLRVLSEARGGLSDGNVLWDAFPTFDGLGPRGDNSHCSEQSADGRKQQEWVDAESFVPKAVLNATALIDLLTRARGD